MSVSSEEAARLAQAGYSVGEEIGRGTSGVVYLAHQRVLDRNVALKRVGIGAADQGTGRRLDAEVAALVALEHPGVIRLMDVLRYPESVWFVTEYVAGPTLRRVLDLSGGISPADALGVVGQLAEVLDYLASRNVVHRDLKPANVFLTPAGRVKVGDLGIALTGAAARVTRPGLVVGTPSYLSPEQARGGDDLSPASDRYSLGVMAYELFAGRVPFVHDGNVLALLGAHGGQPPPDPRSLRPQLPRAVAEVLLLPLAKSPADRPPTAREFRRRLEAAADAGWPGWRQAVDSGALARRFASVPAPGPASADRLTATGEQTAGATGAPPPQPVPPPQPPPPPPQAAPIANLRPKRLRRSRWAVPAVVFAVALAGSFLAVRAVGSGSGGVLRVTAIQLSCSPDAATARLRTNGARGVVRYRWSPGGPGVLRVGSQAIVDLTDRPSRAGLEAGSLTFYLTSPGSRSASCVTGARSSTG